MKFLKQWKMLLKNKRYIRTSSSIKKAILNIIRFYQYGISPLFGPNCRFNPTCSQYTYEAIVEHGIIKGIYLGIKRILRCNPFFRGGYDPVPLKSNINKKNRKSQ